MTWAITWNQPVFRIKFYPGDTLTPEVRSRNTLDEINRNAFYGLVKLPRRCERKKIIMHPGKQGPRSGEITRLPPMWGGLENPGVDTIRGLSLLLVISLAPRGFSPGIPVFPSP